MTIYKLLPVNNYFHFWVIVLRVLVYIQQNLQHLAMFLKQIYNIQIFLRGPIHDIHHLPMYSFTDNLKCHYSITELYIQRRTKVPHIFVLNHSTQTLESLSPKVLNVMPSNQENKLSLLFKGKKTDLPTQYKDKLTCKLFSPMWKSISFHKWLTSKWK